MRKIFIDAGCWNGISTKLFFENRMVEQYKTTSEGFVGYGFDPLTCYLDQMKELEQKYPFVFINKAAWIYDGEVEFGEFPRNESSSIKNKKFNFVSAKVRKVPCLNFSKWIEIFRGDYVVVKMNIEGAETDILEKMIADGTIGIIKYMLWEDHYKKLDGEHMRRIDAIKKQLPFEFHSYIRVPL